MANTFDDLKRLVNDAVEKALEDTAVEAQSRARDLVPVDTGNLRDSIQATKLGDLSYSVTANTDYAYAVHEGHTRQNGTFVQGRPFLTQALEEKRQEIEQKIKDNL